MTLCRAGFLLLNIEIISEGNCGNKLSAYKLYKGENTGNPSLLTVKYI